MGELSPRPGGLSRRGLIRREICVRRKFPHRITAPLKHPTAKIRRFADFRPDSFSLSAQSDYGRHRKP